MISLFIPRWVQSHKPNIVLQYIYITMCFNVVCRKVEIQVKGPKENELRIHKSSIPGKYAKNPIVFVGGDNIYLPASFSTSASLQPFVIIATIHARGGQLLTTVKDLPKSFLPFKRIVFDLEAPYEVVLVPVTGWWDDLSRILKFRIRKKTKSLESVNIPAVPKSLTPIPDLGPVAHHFGDSPSLSCIRDKVARLNDNGSHDSEMNESHLLCTDIDQPTSLPESLSQRTDESCERGTSSSQTPYYDAETSPFSTSNSPNMSRVPIEKNAGNKVSRFFSKYFTKYLNEMKGMMDLQAG